MGTVKIVEFGDDQHKPQYTVEALVTGAFAQATNEDAAWQIRGAFTRRKDARSFAEVMCVSQPTTPVRIVGHDATSQVIWQAQLEIIPEEVPF